MCIYFRLLLFTFVMSTLCGCKSNKSDASKLDASFDKSIETEKDSSTKTDTADTPATSSSDTDTNGSTSTSDSTTTPDSCVEVDCFTPPSNQCDEEGNLIQYEAFGNCVEGKCQYLSKTEACGDDITCSEDMCPNNPCMGVRCLTPPDQVCSDDTSILTYAKEGYCEDGECIYLEEEHECSDGCQNDVCGYSACDGFYCDKPPAPYCLDENTLATYQNGRCESTTQGAECHYRQASIPCENGCANGQCASSPCRGVGCLTPPARYCMDDTLIVFEVQGTCNAGMCEYRSTEYLCENGCESGACVGDDPCANISCSTPTAPHCVDGVTLRTFDPQGGCHDGFCDYTPIDITCDDGCHAGACRNDPCAGVVCQSPPPSTCDGDIMHFFDDAGVCEDGVCTYTENDEECSDGCTMGRCNEDPCHGVSCNSPPASYCTDERHRRVFEDAGSCTSTGYCEYTFVEEACPLGCQNGLCLERGTDSGSDGDTDTDSDIDTDDDTETDVDSDTTTDSTEETCEYQCSALCYTIGGTVKPGVCLTPLYKCCDFGTTDSETETETETGSETENTSTTCEDFQISSADGKQSMPKGGTLQLRAQCIINGVEEDVTEQVTWTSENPNIASVSNAAGRAGRVKAESEGKAILFAVYSNGEADIKSPSLEITVSPNKLTTITITPLSAVITEEGGIQQFHADCKYQNGNKRGCTGEVTWVSSNESVIDITGGQATAKSPGQSEISANMDGVESEQSAVISVEYGLYCSELSVDTNGQTSMVEGTYLDATASCRFSNGETGDVTDAVQWKSSNTSAAEINDRGHITANEIEAPDETEISATYTNPNNSSVTKSINLQVIQKSVAAISISPVTHTINTLKGTKTFNASCTYDNGMVDNCPKDLDWQSSNPNVASIDAGIATALTNGKTIISASLGTIVSDPTATLTVSLGAICTHLTISTGGTESMIEGTALQVSAKCDFDDGRVGVDVTSSVDWQSSDTDAALFSDESEGMLLGQTVTEPKSIAIVATIDNPDGHVRESNKLSILVVPKSLESIKIGPPNKVIDDFGQSIQYEAWCFYDNDEKAYCTQTVTWSSSDKTVADIGVNTGIATPVSNGRTDITAEWQQQTSNAAKLQVDLGPICELLKIEGNHEIPLGMSTQLTATCLIDGLEVDVSESPNLVWRFLDPAYGDLATLSKTGEIQTIDEGEVVVAAEFANPNETVQKETHNITITEAILVDVYVIPDAPEDLPIGRSVSFAAWCVYSDNTESECTEDAQWLDAEGVGDFSDFGLFTATDRGDTLITATVDLGEYTVSSDAVPLSVVSPVVETVTIAPDEATINVGESQVYTALCTMSNDPTPFDCTEHAIFKSDPVDIVTIENNAAIGSSVGETKIIATVDGLDSEPAVLTVTDVAKRRVRIPFGFWRIPLNWRFGLASPKPPRRSHLPISKPHPFLVATKRNPSVNIQIVCA